MLGYIPNRQKVKRLTMRDLENVRIQFKFFHSHKFTGKSHFLNCNWSQSIAKHIDLFTFAVPKMTYGVTGNTSDFGSEESRFEP